MRKFRIAVLLAVMGVLVLVNLLILGVWLPGFNGFVGGFATGPAAPPRPGLGSEALVAAAADLGPALKEMAAAFEQETGKRIRITLGSSGNLVAQIRNGAPFDVFLSANVDYAQALIEQGWAEPELLALYAEGRLALWARRDAAIDVQTMNMNALADARVHKVAIANPTHAPYGMAAEAALRHYQMYDKAKPKLVVGENVAQAAQFAHAGNADLAIIALSLALAPEMQKDGVFWMLPAESHPPIRQAAVLTKGRWRNVPATRFLAFLRSEKAQAILRRYGYEVPEPAP